MIISAPALSLLCLSASQNIGDRVGRKDRILSHCQPLVHFKYGSISFMGDKTLVIYLPMISKEKQVIIAAKTISIALSGRINSVMINEVLLLYGCSKTSCDWDSQVTPLQACTPRIISDAPLRQSPAPTNHKQPQRHNDTRE